MVLQAFDVPVDLTVHAGIGMLQALDLPVDLTVHALQPGTCLSSHLPCPPSHVGLVQLWQRLHVGVRPVPLSPAPKQRHLTAGQEEAVDESTQMPRLNISPIVTYWAQQAAELPRGHFAITAKPSANVYVHLSGTAAPL